MALSVLPNIPSISYSDITRAQQGIGRVSIPVGRSQYLYARFKHVRGVPQIQESAQQGGGVSIPKLYSLDRLIDRFIELKGKEAVIPDVQNISSQEEMEAIIENMSKNLHEQVAAGIKNDFHPGAAYINPGTNHGFFIDCFV